MWEWNLSDFEIINLVQRGNSYRSRKHRRTRIVIERVLHVHVTTRYEFGNGDVPLTLASRWRRILSAIRLGDVNSLRPAHAAGGGHSHIGIRHQSVGITPLRRVKHHIGAVEVARRRIHGETGPLTHQVVSADGISGKI